MTCRAFSTRRGQEPGCSPNHLKLTELGATTITVRPTTLNDVFLHLTTVARPDRNEPSK